MSSSTASDQLMPSSTSLSTHLFKLAKLNSEFKYVANSIVRDTPRYAYPAIVDIHDWQRDFIHQLDDWEQNIPVSEQEAPYLYRICRLRCLELRIVCLRPSPAIPTPSTNSIYACHKAAQLAIDIFSQLYRLNLLVYSWDTFHSVALTTITILYCVKAAPGVTTPQALGDDLNGGLRVLGAIGEHSIGAKRCRDILDELGRALIARLQEQPSASSLPSTNLLREAADSGMSQVPSPNGGTSGGGALYSDLPSLPADLFNGLGMDETFSEQFGFGESFDDADTIMRSLFDGFIPTNINQV